jgi:hypothetical protein
MIKVYGDKYTELHAGKSTGKEAVLSAIHRTHEYDSAYVIFGRTHEHEA